MGNVTHILPVLQWLEVVIAFVSGFSDGTDANMCFYCIHTSETELTESVLTVSNTALRNIDYTVAETDVLQVMTRLQVMDVL